jgi:ShK domain-like
MEKNKNLTNTSTCTTMPRISFIPFISIVYVSLCYLFLYKINNKLYVIAGKDNSISDCVASSTDFESFECYPSRVFIEDVLDDDDDDNFFTACSDSAEKCSEWAEQQECQRNPNYMLVNCRKSCGTCVSGHAGITQVIPEADLHRPAIIRLLQTAKYMHELTSRNYNAHKWCFNSDSMCTYFALQGKCESEPETMTQKCAATCQVCKG